MPALLLVTRMPITMKMVLATKCAPPTANKSGNLILGLTPSSETRLELNLEATREDDVLFPGANMDSPYSDADNIRFKIEHQPDAGVLRRFQGWRPTIPIVKHLNGTKT